MKTSFRPRYALLALAAVTSPAFAKDAAPAIPVIVPKPALLAPAVPVRSWPRPARVILPNGLLPPLPGEIDPGLPHQTQRALPGQVVRALPGQLVRPLPGQIDPGLPGQSVPPLPGQIVPPLPGQIIR